MRIGLVIYGSLEVVSGGYLYDRKLVEQLKRSGHTVEIISTPWRGYLGNLADNISNSLIDRLSSLHLDLVLQDELNHASLAWQNHRLHKILGVPLVAIVHHLRCSESHPGWQNNLYRLVERRYLDSVDGFIFNSQATQQAVTETLSKSIPDLPAIVAYPAGDRLLPEITAEEIRTRCVSSGHLRLIFLANLIPRKGLHHLLQALAQMSDVSCELEVVGSLEFDPAYARRVRRLVTHLNLAGRVRLRGALEDQELVRLLKSCQVMVVPSSHEGFGIAYLEGFGFGLPAVAGIGGATAEIITHGQDGFLVDPRDTAALAGWLLELANNRTRLAAMSLAAQRRYQAHPTWEQSTARMEQFLLGFHNAPH
jgi:glycosyltransferase involved in cell wall biosynthesis